MLNYHVEILLLKPHGHLRVNISLHVKDFKEDAWVKMNREIRLKVHLQEQVQVTWKSDTRLTKF